MPYKCARPEERTDALASTTSSAATSFYDPAQASTYTTAANASIQRDLTVHALDLLHAIHPDQWISHPLIWLLDVGAGSGLSTQAAVTWLQEHHASVDSVITAFDISASMLSLNAGSHSTHTTESTAVIETYCGNAAQPLPLRAAIYHGAIGISMLQWLNKQGLQTFFQSLRTVLVNDQEAAAVFQIYAESIDQVTMMENAAKAMGFPVAEAFIAFPHAAPAKKWYLLVQTTFTTSRNDETMAPQCIFGRRFRRRCAWKWLQHASFERLLAIRDRLAREHVKEAWHIWRKYKRSISQPPHAAVGNAKAKRSLELWTSDRLIGQALAQAFGATLVYDTLLQSMDQVVEIVHQAYSTAVALDENHATSS